MGYNKHKTPAATAATPARITGLTAIEPELTLGVAGGQQLLDDYAKATEAYNLLPGKADDALNKLKAQEKRDA